MLFKRGVQLALKPNPQPLPYKGRGARLKASLRLSDDRLTPTGREMEVGFQE
ncbi:MAG: hypothetical protein V7K97_05830 [Nostoc sp.]|uniref:hypothetical protein n=1 Tax=Nostoc sp. TaxID=1180 RepID=UPI002FF80A14